MSRPHYWLLIIGGLGYTFDGMDNALVAFILPSMAKEWGLENGMLGILAAATPVGYLIGALIAGVLGDRFGRKPVMMYALFIYAAFTLIAAVAPNYEIFAAARIIAGLGIGAESVIIAPYLAEFVPPAKRGWFVGCLTGFFGFGYVMAALLGRYMVPVIEDGWRWAQVVTAVPILMLLWWRRSLRESPRYLISRGREAEAEVIVEEYEQRVRKATKTELPPYDPVTTASTAPEPPKIGMIPALRLLLSHSFRRRTAVVWLVWFVNVFAFYGFFTWIPTLLLQRGIEVTKSFEFTIIIYMAQIPGFFSAAWVSERIDRKNTIALYLTGATASAIWLSQSGSPALILTSGALLSFFLNGSVAATYSYTPELFPTHVRATATGLASAFGRIGSITAPIIIGFSSATIGFAGVFGVTAAILFAGVFGVIVLGVSTVGVSLEDLNEKPSDPEQVPLALEKERQ
ncbi:MFS transporter [Rhodococcus sp. NPDC057529]|uniref:MFS transporter n=1 Tax=Rhodococcus sp. NPDC057529 TaxID=3346158 RepID=UPI003672887C